MRPNLPPRALLCCRDNEDLADGATLGHRGQRVTHIIESEPRTDHRVQPAGFEVHDELFGHPRRDQGLLLVQQPQIETVRTDALHQEQVEWQARDLARREAHDNETATGSQPSHRRLGVHATDGIDNEMRATVARLLDCRLEVVALVIDHGLGSGSTTRGHFVVARGSGKDVRAVQAREIDGRLADSARGAEHDHPLLGFESTDGVQRVVGGRVGDAERRSCLQIDLRAEPDERMLGHDDAFGERTAHRGRGHEITPTEVPDARAELDDLPGAFRSRREGRLEVHLILARDQQHIREVDRGSRNPHDHLTGSGAGLLDVVELDLPHRAETHTARCSHAPASLCSFRRAPFPEPSVERSRYLQMETPMAWDFETEPEFQEKLDWIEAFVREEIEPIDVLWGGLEYTPLDGPLRAVVEPLKEQVRERGLWACHLGPELGGAGFGQLKLSLMNEILGRSSWAPIIFGTQAPDTGNAEIIAHYGTDEQKARYLQPLLDGEIFSCYSMTEPQAGADPTLFTTTAVRDGDEWVIDGWKFFSSNAKTASFFIVMAVTDTEANPREAMSMFLVPAETPGINIVRNLGLTGEALDEGSHALIHYEGVRVPADGLLGDEGKAFAIAQTRLGGGRIHHAMRTIGMCNRAFEMMCERALSREVSGGLLAEKQFVQGYVADSYAQLQQFRLFVLHTAWAIDRYQDYRRVRKDISAVKATMPGVLHDIVQRAMQVHGALGVSNEMPLGRLWLAAPALALADGPTEVHKVTVARQVLREYRPSDDTWPTQHLPRLQAAAREKFAAVLEHEVGNL